jgi:hypothetical protein
MPSIQDIMDKKKAFEEELSAHGKAALSEEFKKVFDAHQDLVAIRWRQYTPYFNDGDACRFSVREFYTKMATTAEDAGDYEDGFDWEEGVVGEAVGHLQCITKDVYLAVFGDHCQVTATREGFEVDEYSHD